MLWVSCVGLPRICPGLTQQLSSPGRSAVGGAHWACWARHRLHLSVWSSTFKEARPGCGTWWQQHSKKTSSNAQALSWYLHISHWSESHTQARVTVEDVVTRRCDSLQATNVTSNHSASLMGLSLILLPIHLTLESCYSLTKFLSYLLHILSFKS